MDTTSTGDDTPLAGEESGTVSSPPITSSFVEDTSVVASTLPTDNNVADGGHEPSPEPEPALRRSSRRKPLPAGHFDGIEPASSEVASEPAKKVRPKRKAALSLEEEAAAAEQELALLREVLSPMEPAERDKFQGWVELESDPSFFQAMLFEMGAGDLKIMEFFTTEHTALEVFPKPVHGLIFLYQCGDMDEDAEERHDCPEGLWFANQTTANACATVALMNVAMNIPNASFGPKLEEFKNETASLSSPLKGHALNTNGFLRSIHNTLAHRIELLNEDLLVKNNHDAWVAENNKKNRNIKKGKGKGKGKGKSNSNAKKKKSGSRYNPDDAAANHYIAYIPYDGKVWELDGLETKPLCLGSFTDDNWVQLALDIINTRMTVINSQDLITYNLLAMCKSPVSDLIVQLTTNLACSGLIDEEYSQTQGWPHASLWVSAFPPTKLSEFGLTLGKVRSTAPPQSFLDRVARPDFDQNAGAIMMAELARERDAIEAKYLSEIMFHEEAMEKWRGRQRDYIPFIHKLLETLLENGTLEYFLDKHTEPQSK